MVNSNDEGSNQIEAKRVAWRSRRGLLELDLILVPFTQTHYFSLSENQQVLYKKILELDDMVLLDWIHNRASIPAEAESLIQLIRRSMT